MVLALFLLTAALGLVSTPIVRSLAFRLGVVDHPGPRKVHASPVPRLGRLAVAVAASLGLAIVAVAASSLGWEAVAPNGELTPILAGAALVLVIGIIDDIRWVPAWAKLLVESMAALIVIRSGVVVDHATIAGHTYMFGVFTVPITLVWILTITDAFNLMDGLDGLSSGLAVIASTTCVVILLARGHRAEALLLVAVVGALVGFLPYNFQPASIFLGDAGSLLIGFLLGVTAIAGFQKVATTLAVGLPLMIFALPLLDVIASVIRRATRASSQNVSFREAFLHLFQADRGHIHHRLIGRGFSHRGAVLMLYLVAILFSSLALLTFQGA